MSLKYYMRPPRDGDSYHSILIAEIEINGKLETNFILAAFHIQLPNAEQECRDLLKKLRNEN